MAGSKRSVALIRNVIADETTGATVEFSPPAWADVCILHCGVTATDGTTPSLTGKFQVRNPDSTGTDVDVTGAAFDAATTASNRFVAIGRRVGAVAGSGYDAVPAPLQREMQVVFTQDRADADETYTYKAWLEFIGYDE